MLNNSPKKRDVSSVIEVEERNTKNEMSDKEETLQSETSNKKIKIGEGVVSMNVTYKFDIQTFYEQIIECSEHKDRKDGRPFTSRMNNHIVSCCYWELTTPELTKRLEECKTFPNIFCQPIYTHSGQVFTCFIFNHNATDYPLNLFLSDKYSKGNAYCSLDNRTKFGEEKFRNSQHSFLSLLKIILGIAIWIESSAPIWHLIVPETKDKSAIVTSILDRLWIINGNCGSKDTVFSHKDLQVVSTPIFPSMEKKKCTKEFMMDILFRVSRHILKLETLKASKKSTFPCPRVKMLRSIWKFITMLVFDEKETTLKHFICECRSAISWIKKNSKWPEIRWKIEDENNCTEFIPQRCIELLATDTPSVIDFDKKVRLSGTATWSIMQPQEEKEEQLFGVKPLLMSLEWNQIVGLKFKIILNRTGVFFKNLATQLYEAHVHWNTIDYKNFVNKIMLAIPPFVEKLAALHAESKYLPLESLIKRTYINRRTSNKHNQPLQIDICLYGHYGEGATIERLGDCYPYVLTDYDFRGGRTYPSSKIQHLLKTHTLKDNHEKNNVWEFGLLILQLYNVVLQDLDGPKTSLKALTKSLVTGSDRLYAFNYLGGQTFVFLMAYILDLNVKRRPTLKQLINSSIYRSWTNSRDLQMKLQIFINDDLFENESEKEKIYYDQILLDESEQAIDRVIMMNNNWKNLSVKDCEEVVEEFTKCIKPCEESNIILRNRRPLPVKFKHLDSVEIADGPGPRKQGITWYCKAIEKLQLFKHADLVKSNSVKHSIKQNPGHWYSFGMILNHCILNQYPFRFASVPFLFRMAMKGPSAKFDINDVASIDPNLAKMYVDLLFQSNDELESLCLDLGDFGIPGLSGNVTTENVALYIDGMIRKKILSGYDIACIEALQEGYNVTPPQYQPSEYNLWSKISNISTTVTPEDILSSIEVDVMDDHFLSEHGNCLFQKRDGKHICSGYHQATWSQCPISCLANFIETKLNNNKELLEGFLTFITGTSFFENNVSDYIRIQMVDSEVDKYPHSQTCFNILQLYMSPNSLKYDESHFDQSFQDAFDTRFEEAILNNSSTFGFV